MKRLTPAIRIAFRVLHMNPRGRTLPGGGCDDARAPHSISYRGSDTFDHRGCARAVLGIGAFFLISALATGAPWQVLARCC